MDWLLICLATCLTVASLTVKLIVDHRLWKAEKPVNHSKEWKLVVLSNLPSIAMFTFCSNAPWYISLPASSLAIAWFFWLFFDGIYNVSRGQNWWFTGTDDPDDAKTDNFLQKLKLWQQIAIKVGGFVFFLLLYILTSNYFK